jgi:16S rRNA (uracil1498-N3)-methyltransferase
MELRLFTQPTTPLAKGARLQLPDAQRHYLLNVMRTREGDTVHTFNGVDGEWSANVELLDKKRGALCVLEQLRRQPQDDMGPTLLFGVLKSSRLPMLVEKTSELGVGNLQPVLTQHCAVRKLNVQRLQAVAVEAAEQSRRLTVPQLEHPESLGTVLAHWDPSRPLYVCDERANCPTLSARLAMEKDGLQSPGVLIGPEGGFAREEFETLSNCDFVRSVSLGPNTLRAETAALAALAVLSCR